MKMHIRSLRGSSHRALYLPLLLGWWAASGVSGWAADARPPLAGDVVDAAGRPVPGALITVRGAQGSVLAQAGSDAQGAFTLSPLPPGRYSVTALAGTLERRDSLLVVGPEPEKLRLVLEIVPIHSSVNVTASRGIVEESASTGAVVAVRDRDEFAGRTMATIGHALEGSPGVLVQETTRGQVSPYLRGLTGYQTLLLVDGIRYNTSTFRSGPNQYLAYVQPAQVETIEVILGPTGATYGSDSLGGSVNVLTVSPRFSASSRLAPHGEFALNSASADVSGGGSGQVGLSNRRFAWIAGGSAQRFNNLKPGGAEDSRNAFRRYLGLTASEARGVLGERLVGTAFAEHGVHSKLAVRPTEGQSLTVWFARSALEGVRSYRDQLGGVGRVQSDSTPQALDFAYARYEKLRVGFLDSLAGTFSLNSQKDGTVRGGTRFTDSSTTDRSKVNSFGYAGQAATHIGGRHALVFGGELYDEHVFSTRSARNPVTLATTQDRPQYPNDSRYGTSGLFVQSVTESASRKLRLLLGARLTAIGFHSYADRTRDASGRLLGVADSDRAFHDVSYHASVAWQFARLLNLHVLAGRGFRAPNLNDLGSIGVTTLGYDIPIEETLAARPVLGVDSSEGSSSSGKPAQKLRPESLHNVEMGLGARTRRLYARAQVFDAELLDPIASRTLLFPASAVPATLAGISVHALPATPGQAAQGVTTVATDLTPRAIKASANDGHTRYYGLESLFRFEQSSRLWFESAYSLLAGRDLNPNRPVRRLPPQQGLARIRYFPKGRLWVDCALRFAGPQSRLAGGDLDDDRIGASRSRSDIASFFAGGMAAAFVQPGPDGKRGTADDVFTPTGETLAAIQNRLLPIGSTINGVAVSGNGIRVPLYLQTDGWWTIDIRGGVPLGERLRVRFGISNPADRNYRAHGSGIDAPGRDVCLGLGYRF